MSTTTNDTSRYRKSPGRKAYIMRHVDALRKKRMISLIKIKGGGCKVCGYNRCTAALEFHHRDPTQKLFTLGITAMTKAWKTVLAEAEKCDLLCSNCHREQHWPSNC